MTSKKGHASFWMLTILLACTSVALGQPRKIALLIGVGTYKHPDFEPLQAASAIDLMSNVLQEKGFEASNIRILTGESATRKQIDAAMKEMAEMLQEGDLFFLHLYTHGVQIRDHSGDEPDGLDEAFAAFDSRFLGADAHEQLLIDDHLETYINRLRRAVGSQGHMCVLMDACHSGTGMRAASSDMQTAPKARKAWTLSDGQSAPMAPFVVFFSAYPHQKSREVSIGNDQRMGLMTWSFCRSLHRASDSTSYRALFEQVSLHLMERVAHRQTPILDGDADLQVFGRALPRPPAYFRVYDPVGPQEAILQAGMLQGVHAGATFKLFPPDTRDTGLIKPLAYGTVLAEGLLLTECRLQLDRPLDADVIAPAWAMPASFRLPAAQIALCVETADTLTRAQWRRQLDAVGVSIISCKVDGPEMTLRPAGRHTWALYTEDNDLLWEGSFKNKLPSDLILALKGYAHAQLLRSLTLEGSGYTMSFSATTMDAPDNWMAAGLAVRQRREVAMLRIINHSRRPLYYCILDIDAKHRVTTLVPGPSWQPADCRLDPGEQRIHRVIFHEPGREVLKLIATPTPLDFRPAIGNRGNKSGNTEIAARLMQHFKGDAGPNRGQEGAYSGQDAGVSTVILEVIPEPDRNR